VTGVDQIDLATAGATVNNVLTLLNMLKIAGKVTTVNGATSGTATITEYMNGSLKLTQITFSNFRNGSVSNQDTATSVAWNGHGVILIDDAGWFAVVNSGTTATMNVLNTFNNPGTFLTQTILKGYQLVFILSAFNTYRFVANDTGAHNGSLLIIGT